jgi:pimeloyl-ACP methyl ester carboxylesterase
MKKTIKYASIIIVLWILLANFFILKNRWSDNKAYNVFKAKSVPLKIYDTTINDTNIHYAISGSDTLPTLAIIHGSPGSWMHYMKYMWDEEVRRKFRIVAIDRPGFGHSNFGKAYHLQEQANLILPVLKQISSNNKPLFLMGHSMGGPVAVQLAANEPSLFKTIIIVAGSIDVSQEKEELWRKVMDKKPLIYLLPGAFAPSNTELLYLKKDLILLQSEFKKITTNIIFVHGTKDTWVPIENVTYGKKMMINAASIKIDTIVNADHQIPWKNYQELKQILLNLY